ncbi:MAG: cation transporter [Bacteroidota bacterium]|nr:cation transporter [Bacteroidota bacterium]
MKFYKLIALFSAILLTQACGENKASETTNKTTETFKVWGNCDMCKETIEGSLKVDGISKADWNSDTDIMTVNFDSDKISIDQIHSKIAAVGYDTDKHKADDKVYSGLPECCQYERK